MPDITLPTDGQLNWGDPLNSAISTVDNDALNALSNIANHTANSPADPHGDRAFAQSLVSPITSGTNQANGYVKLDGTGHIPANLISGTTAGGLYTNVYDAVGQFGMFTGSSDTSVKLQNALNAAANAGGGIVYVGPGTYSLGDYVVIGNNTWLLLAEGCVLQRIQGATNPPYMISNVRFNTNNTPASSFKITGGKLDAVGSQNLASACTPIFFIQSQKVEIRDVFINNVFNNPCIEVNGSSVVRIDFCHFNGTGSGSTQATVPCIRLNTSEFSTTPGGLLSSLYNSSVSFLVKITDCEISGTGSNFGAFGSFCGTDLVGSVRNNDITITSVSTRYPANNNTPVDSSHWQNFSIINCNFNDTNNNVTGSDWSNMPAMTNSWSIGDFAKYRMTADGNLQVAFKNLRAGTTNDGTTIWASGSLPSVFRPPTFHRMVCWSDSLRTTVNAEAAALEFAADGSVNCQGVASNATRVDLYAIIPLTV